MLRISMALSAAILILSTPASAQMAAPAPNPASAPVTSLPPTADGWSLEKDTGTCVLKKGADTGPQIAIASRGRIMLSDPNLSDASFIEGQQAQVTLRWNTPDGTGARVEATEAATIILPGGGAQRLKARKAYIIPYDTLALANMYKGATGSGGFLLGVERAGAPVWWMDTSGSGGAMQAFLDCADSVMIKQVQQPVVEPKKKRR